MGASLVVRARVSWPLSLIRASARRPHRLPARALDHVEAWLESPTLALLTESAAHWPTLRALLAGGRIAGVQAHDARVAVLCRQHGVRERWSADRDSSRFARLAVVTRWSARDRRKEMPHAN